MSNDGENGADGASWPDTMNTIDRAILNVQTGRNLSGLKYGSHRLLTTEFFVIKRLLNREYRRMTGRTIDQSAVRISDDELRCKWEDIRKGWYKVHKKKVARVTPRPLFGETEGAAIVYAYSGLITTYPGLRIVKLGYTAQEVAGYLRAKKRQHDPKLLATTIGDKQLESEFLRKWSHIKCDGNEWFWPTRELFNWISDVYDFIADDARQHQEEAEQLYESWKRTF